MIIVRFAWMAFGLMSAGLGIVGAFLPLLPTVPLMLLAAFCFAKSSERLHRWLITHPTFGPPIVDWQEHGAISRKAKCLSAIMMTCVLMASIIAGLPLKLILIQTVTLGCAASFVLSRPVPPSDQGRARVRT